MDRETGKPRGFGFLTYADDSSLNHVLNTRPIVFDGKEVDVKRAQSKNDPQSLQIRRQQRMDNPEMAYGMQQGGAGARFNNYNTGASGGGGGMGGNAWQMNPMMMGMMGQGGDMSQMYQNMGWGNQNWNPQMAWQQMMASMAGNTGGGMDMGAMMNNMGMMGSMGGTMGSMGGMGSMSPPSMKQSMSPTVNAASAVPTGASAGGDDRTERSGSASAPSSSRQQRGGSVHNGASRPVHNGASRPPPTGPRHDRERSPGRGGDGGYRRERSPDRRDDNRRYDSGQRNRY